MSSFVKLGLSSTAFAFSFAMLASPAQASLTLPTTNIDANTVFSFSSASQTMMNRLGVDVVGMGNSKAVAGSTMAFSMPATEVTVDISLLPPSITPVSGKATGAALGFFNEDGGGFVLANFALDFKRGALIADFTSPTGTSKAIDVFNFQIAQGLQVSMNGGLSLNMDLDHMMLTSGAQNKFASALGLEPYAVAAMGMLDFGTLAIDINPALRTGVSDKAFSADKVFASSMATPPVPEAPKVVLMALGLLGMTAVSRRKQRI